MAKPKRPTDADLVRRLIAVKMMVAGMKDAMPQARADLWREACESLDDMIEELAR